MRRLGLVTSLAALATVAAAEPDQISTVLQRAGDRVERYLARAQSIVCTEVVRLQPLTNSWTHDGNGRTVESELRLSWGPTIDGRASMDTQMLRQVLRVNGHSPRSGDSNDCTTPEQQTEEPQPLSVLLLREGPNYEFRMAGQARIDGRAATI